MTTWITSQAVINIGAVIGVLPVTGIPLPFISFGGSSLVITLAAMGILMNIAAAGAFGPHAVRPASPTRPGVTAAGHVDRPGGARAGSGTHWWPAAARPATCSRPWPSPRRWSPPATTVAPSSSWDPNGARTPQTLAGTRASR